MKRRKIVAGNWKMNLNWVEAYDLASAIRSASENLNGVEKIIFPPYPYLQMLSVIFEGRNDLKTGAQNCSEHKVGAFTGEVSAEMIASAGCGYVLTGHSERRMYFDETSEQLIHKIHRGIEQNLGVVFCFGERLEERKAGKHFETVDAQLRDVLSHFPQDKTGSLILAYEPVWAIGTGETASPEQAQEMHAHVRKCLAEIFDEEKAQIIPVLYGGSVNPANADQLFACPDVDGGLIGGASLKATDFCNIIKARR
jgi:triosephosphate isomerase